MVVLIFLLITWYTIQTQSIFGSCDSFRIGKREHGDSIILKKILLSVPSQQPTNHTVIYEYRATKAVSCIEYQVENILENENVVADIVFTGEYSLEARFDIINITELVIVMSIYGFDQFNLPLNFIPILVPQFLVTENNASPKFGLGFRQPNDELIYFYTQTSARTKHRTNHSLSFTANLEHFLTYVSFSVDSKSAGATFLEMTDHSFSGIVYDVNANILFANMYVYGYKREKLPSDYESIFPLPNVTALEEALLKETAAAATYDPYEPIYLKGSRQQQQQQHHRDDGSSSVANKLYFRLFVEMLPLVGVIYIYTIMG